MGSMDRVGVAAFSSVESLQGSARQRQTFALLLHEPSAARARVPGCGFLVSRLRGQTVLSKDSLSTASRMFAEAGRVVFHRATIGTECSSKVYPTSNVYGSSLLCIA